MTGSDGLPLAMPAEPVAAETTTLVEAVVERVRTPLENLLERSSELLTAYPLRANALISGVLCSLGDALAQYAEYKMDVMSPGKEQYNFARTGRMAVFGFFLCGPLLSLWYRTLGAASEALQVGYKPAVLGSTRIASWMERLVPSWEAASYVQAARSHSPAGLLVGKVVADSVLFQLPFLNLYFGFMGLLEGLSPAEIVEKTRDSFYRAWGLGFLVWAPVQVINLHYVPVAFHAVVVSVVNVGWKTILSLLNHYNSYGSGKERAVRQSHEDETRQDIARLEATVRALEADLAAARHQGKLCALLCPPCAAAPRPG